MLKSLSRKHAYQKDDSNIGYQALLRELLRTTITPSYNHITHGKRRVQRIYLLHRLNRLFTETKLFTSICDALDILPAVVVRSVNKGNPLSPSAIKRRAALKPVN